MTACSWSRPRNRPPTIVIPERLMPANSAPVWQRSDHRGVHRADTECDRVIDRDVLFRSAEGRRPDCAAAQTFTQKEHHPVERQEDGRGQRLGEQRPELVLEEQARRPPPGWWR